MSSAAPKKKADTHNRVSVCFLHGKTAKRRGGKGQAREAPLPWSGTRPCIPQQGPFSLTPPLFFPSNAIEQVCYQNAEHQKGIEDNANLQCLKKLQKPCLRHRSNTAHDDHDKDQADRHQQWPIPFAGCKSHRHAY